MGAGSFRQSINNQQGKEMSTDIVKASVTPPPTKSELFQAAAKVIAEENEAKNKKRWADIEKVREAFHAELRKAARSIAAAAVKSASFEAVWRDNNAYMVHTRIRVTFDEKLKALKKAVEDAENVPHLDTDPKRIAKTLRERSAGHTPENLRVETIIATPALRKAVKEFGEKLLATPTQKEKRGAIEVAGK